MSLEWMDAASCTETSPDAFFPEPGEASRTRDAKKVCAGCDVAAQCLQWAFDNEFTVGIFGGMTAVERKALRRRRAGRPRNVA